MANKQNPNSQTMGLKAGWHPTKPLDPDAKVGVNLKLPAPLHRQLRIKSLMLQMTLDEAIGAAVEEWVNK